jgi:hypothetical protein
MWPSKFLFLFGQVTLHISSDPSHFASAEEMYLTAESGLCNWNLEAHNFGLLYKPLCTVEQGSSNSKLVQWTSLLGLFNFVLRHHVAGKLILLQDTNLSL